MNVELTHSPLRTGPKTEYPGILALQVILGIRGIEVENASGIGHSGSITEVKSKLSFAKKNYSDISLRHPDIIDRMVNDAVNLLGKVPIIFKVIRNPMNMLPFPVVL